MQQRQRQTVGDAEKRWENAEGDAPRQLCEIKRHHRELACHVSVAKPHALPSITRREMAIGWLPLEWLQWRVLGRRGVKERAKR